ncbi:hypothetical protein AAE478_000681 [Parahypoxylon ruwenzoriense]
MDFDTFHSFPLLPAEIRRAIYLFATPPRIVHVQEDWEDEDEFMAWFCDSGPARVKVPSSLAYFAHLWRGRIREFPRGVYTQRELEFYGFTNSRPKQQPWKPSRWAPEIPVHWLLDHPDIAYRLLRRGSIYSLVPVPVLLHTCVESRATLIRSGYQLAFGTRSHEPMTWFHFVKDVLYLNCNSIPHFEIDTWGTTDWGIGQFDPETLGRIQRLAVNDTMLCLPRARFTPSGGTDIEVDPGSDVQKIVRLFPRLEKLYFVEWEKPFFDRFSWGYPVCPSPGPNRTGPAKGRHMGNYEREIWRFVPIEEIDCLFLLMSHSDERQYMANFGYEGEALVLFNGYRGESLRRLKDYTIRNIEVCREEIAKEESLTPWKTPEIEIVHVCTELAATNLWEKRHNIWETLQSLREQCKGIRPTAHPQLCQPGTDSAIYRTVLGRIDDDWGPHDEARRILRSEVYHPSFNLEKLARGLAQAPRPELIMEP